MCHMTGAALVCVRGDPATIQAPSVSFWLNDTMVLFGGFVFNEIDGAQYYCDTPSSFALRIQPAPSESSAWLSLNALVPNAALERAFAASVVVDNVLYVHAGYSELSIQVWYTAVL
jgi:hypothetical protein